MWEEPVKVTELLLVVCQYLLSCCRKCGWQLQLGHPAQGSAALGPQGSLVALTSGACLAARDQGSRTFYFWDLRSKSPTTAGQQWSCRAAEGPRQTTNCLDLAGEQEAINQFKRQFSLINRISFYSCRLVTSKHYGNSLPVEQQKWSYVFSLAIQNSQDWHSPCVDFGMPPALQKLLMLRFIAQGWWKSQYASVVLFSSL